jgi:hypothetical protein
MFLTSKFVPNEHFPLDKALAGHDIVTNLLTSLVIIAFIALIAWIVYEAFDQKKEE